MKVADNVPPTLILEAYTAAGLVLHDYEAETLVMLAGLIVATEMRGRGEPMGPSMARIAAYASQFTAFAGARDAARRSGGDDA